MLTSINMSLRGMNIVLPLLNTGWMAIREDRLAGEPTVLPMSKGMLTLLSTSWQLDGHTVEVECVQQNQDSELLSSDRVESHGQASRQSWRHYKRQQAFHPLCRRCIINKSTRKLTVVF